MAKGTERERAGGVKSNKKLKQNPVRIENDFGQEPKIMCECVCNGAGACVLWWSSI